MHTPPFRQMPGAQMLIVGTVTAGVVVIDESSHRLP